MAEAEVGVGRGESLEAGAVVEGEFAEVDFVLVEVEVDADVGEGGSKGFSEGEHFLEERGGRRGNVGGVGPEGGVVLPFAPEEGEGAPVGGVEVAAVVGFAVDVDLDEFGAAGETMEFVVEREGAVGGEKEGLGKDARRDSAVGLFAGEGVVGGVHPVGKLEADGAKVGGGGVADDDVLSGAVVDFEDEGGGGDGRGGDVAGAGEGGEEGDEVVGADCLGDVVADGEFVGAGALEGRAHEVLHAVEFFVEGARVVPGEGVAEGAEEVAGDAGAGREVVAEEDVLAEAEEGGEEGVNEGGGGVEVAEGVTSDE